MSGPSIKHKHKKRWNPKHPAAIDCISKQAQHKHSILFDVGSNLIAIDNHSSCCISNHVSHFITPLTLKSIKIKVLQGVATSSLGISTLKWKIDNRMGRTDAIVIKNALHVPNGS